MKFREQGYLLYVKPVARPTLSLLFFPPASHTPTGFYLIEPNGLGGNKITLLEKVTVDPRTEKAWYTSCSERARVIAEHVALIKRCTDKGAVWSSLPAEELVDAITNDPSTVAD